MKTYNHTDLHDFKEASANKRIVCFGAGRYAQMAIQNPPDWLDVNCIDCFIDNDKSKHDKTIKVIDRDVNVFPADYLCSVDKENTIILLMIQKHSEIENQIADLTNENIYWFSYPKMLAREQLNLIFSQKSSARFILLYSPDYPNVGDHAIALSERKFLNNHFANTVFEVPSAICFVATDILPEYINDDDIIFITGGGYMGTIWPFGEEVVRNTVSLFPKNPIIVFPQSIYYGNTQENKNDLEFSKTIYNNHNNLLICAREEISFEFIKNAYPSCNCLLVPDMVLFLGNFESDIKREGIAFCLRNDRECAVTGQEKSLLYKAANKLNKKTFEIENFVFEQEYVALEEGEKLVFEKLKEYQSAELVITDRLHGLVFSAITSTPCLVLDNSYHKNRALFKWLSIYKHLALCDNVSEEESIIALIESLLNTDVKYYDNSIFLHHFNDLADYIGKLKDVRWRYEK